MIVEEQVEVRGTRDAVWAVITDIDHAARIVRGIEEIEVVERPATGWVGLRWRETRLLFGKPATVEKWITEAKEGEFYVTRAEDQGFVFFTEQRLDESAGGVTLRSSHETRPQGPVAWLMSLPMRLFFRGVLRRAIREDLLDYQRAVEGGD